MWLVKAASISERVSSQLHVLYDTTMTLRDKAGLKRGGGMKEIDLIVVRLHSFFNCPFLLSLYMLHYLFIFY